MYWCWTYDFENKGNLQIDFWLLKPIKRYWKWKRRDWHIDIKQNTFFTVISNTDSVYSMKSNQLKWIKNVQWDCFIDFLFTIWSNGNFWDKIPVTWDLFVSFLRRWYLNFSKIKKKRFIHKKKSHLFLFKCTGGSNTTQINFISNCDVYGHPYAICEWSLLLLFLFCERRHIGFLVMSLLNGWVQCG